MHSILIPVDGSEHSTKAIKYAIKTISEGLSAKVYLINVQMPVMITVSEFPLYDYDQIEKAQALQAKSVLKRACKLLEEANIDVTKHYEIGPISRTIVEYAKANNCDNIIMGTRGMGAFGNLVMGSVANQVVHLAEVPVTLVK